MATTGRHDFVVWRNDDLCEIPLRVRGVDLTGAPLALQARLSVDTPGSPTFDLRETTEPGVQGIRFVRAELDGDVIVSHLVMRIDLATRQDLPYMGEIGAAATFDYAFLIGGVTRLVGKIVVPGHAYGSDGAPANRPASYGGAPAQMPGGGVTLTIANEDVVSIALDGADLMGERIAAAGRARDEAVDARDSVRPARGIGAPADPSIKGAWYIDESDIANPVDYYFQNGAWTGPYSRKGNPGGNVSAIGTLIGAPAIAVPAGTDMVQTSGYDSVFRGSAHYVADPSWNFGAYPGTGFTDANGRKFRLLGDREINVKSFGAIGNGEASAEADTVAFENLIKFYTAFYRLAPGTDRMGGLAIYVPPGNYRLTRPIVSAAMNIKAQGFALRGSSSGMTRIEWHPEDGVPDRALFYNRGFINFRVENITFYSADQRNTFMRCPMTANNQQRFAFPACQWEGRWFRGFWLTGNNNNSEWLWDGNGGVAGQMRQFVYIPGIESGEDQFLNFTWGPRWNFWPTQHGSTGSGGIIGSITGNVLTVSASSLNLSGSIEIGARIQDTGLATDPVITALGTGTGGAGTYILDQTLASPLSLRPMTVAVVAAFTGSAAAGVLTVSAISAGTIKVGAALIGSGIASGCFVASQIDGTPGGVGTYQIWEPVTFSSRALTTSPRFANCLIDAARGGHFDLLAVDFSGMNAGRVFALRGNTHNLGVCFFSARSCRFEMKTGLVSTMRCEWPQGSVVFDNCDQSSQQQVYPAEATNLDFVYSGTTAPGATIAVDNSVLLGRQRFSYGTNAFEYRSVCRFKSTEFSSWRDPFAAFNIIAGINPAGAWPIELDDCRGVQDRIFNYASWATNTTYTVGQLRTTEVSLFECVQGGLSAANGFGPRGTGQNIVDNEVRWRWVANTPRDYFGSGVVGGIGVTRGSQRRRIVYFGPQLPRSTNRYAEIILPPNAIVVAAYGEASAGSVSSGVPANYTIAADSGAALLTVATATPASEGFYASATGLRHRTGTSMATRLARLTAGTTDQVNNNAAFWLEIIV